LCEQSLKHFPAVSVVSGFLATKGVELMAHVHKWSGTFNLSILSIVGVTSIPIHHHVDIFIQMNANKNVPFFGELKK
jgi:hypothetical protein